MVVNKKEGLSPMYREQIVLVFVSGGLIYLETKTCLHMQCFIPIGSQLVSTSSALFFHACSPLPRLSGKTFTFKFRAMTRCFYPKGLAISTFVRKRKNNISVGTVKMFIELLVSASTNIC